MAINFLFWNTHKNEQINQFLKPLILDKGCNFIVLAEYTDSIKGLCDELSVEGKTFRPRMIPGCERIVIIENCCTYFEPIQASSHYVICLAKICNEEYLIAGTHLPSRMHGTGGNTKAMASLLACDLISAEKNSACQNTIVMGDFNANPFEEALISAERMHAVSDGRIAEGLERTINGENYRMLYNPMWNLLGDVRTIGGSYFYRSNDMVNYFWHIFDQVLLHPKLLGQFDHKSLEIVTEIELECLLKENGRPNEKISDHLPIFFTLKERESNGK